MCVSGCGHAVYDCMLPNLDAKCSQNHSEFIFSITCYFPDAHFYEDTNFDSIHNPVNETDIDAENYEVPHQTLDNVVDPVHEYASVSFDDKVTSAMLCD